MGDGEGLDAAEEGKKADEITQTEVRRLLPKGR